MDIKNMGNVGQAALYQGKPVKVKGEAKENQPVDNVSLGNGVEKTDNKKLEEMSHSGKSNETSEKPSRWKTVLKYAGITAAVGALAGAIGCGFMGMYLSMPIAALTQFLGVEPAMVMADVGLAMAGYGAAFGGAGGALIGTAAAPLLMDDK